MAKRAGENERTAIADAPTLQCQGPYADVWLYGDGLQQFEDIKKRTDELSVRAAINLPKYFERFADGGSQKLTEKMFKKIGKANDLHGNTHQIFEFKNFQVRIYGVIRSYRGKRAFIGTACDPDKKQDRADPRMIKRAAEEAGKIE